MRYYKADDGLNYDTHSDMFKAGKEYAAKEHKYTVKVFIAMAAITVIGVAMGCFVGEMLARALA